jgi:hypothetical protein
MEPPSSLVTVGGSCLKYPFKAGTMYPRAARHASLYEGLKRIDDELARKAKQQDCPHCGGPLDFARWRRNPRGHQIPRSWATRHGLCCRKCRKRVLPPSTLFLGRKVYLGAVVLISVAAKQRRLVGGTARALRRMFGVAKETLARWLTYFSTDLPASPQWKRLRGRLSAEVRDDALPDALLMQFDRRHGEGEAALAACLAFLAAGDFAGS